MAAEARPPADRHSAFANAPMGVALCTPDGVLLDVNRFLEQMLGRPAAQLRGHTNLEFMHPEDVPGAVEAWERLARVPDRPVRFECRLVQAGGHAVPVQTTPSCAAPGAPGERPHNVHFIKDYNGQK